MSKRILLLAIIALVTLGVNTAVAQLPIPGAAEAPAPEAPKDTFGRETPKGLIDGFLSAVRKEDYNRAANYLDLSNYPTAQHKKKGAELSQALLIILDQQGAFKAGAELSSLPEGNTEDGLDPDLENIGYLKKTEKETTDIIAKRFETKDGPSVWKISSDTVKIIPRIAESMALGYLDTWLPKSLITNKLYGVPLGHWVAVGAIGFGAFAIAWILTSIIIIAAPVIAQRNRKARVKSKILHAFVWPIRIYMTVAIFAIIANVVGISIVARQYLATAGAVIAWLAIAWIVWSIIDLSTDTARRRMLRQNRRSALSAIVFFKKAARSILAIIVVVVALKNMGYDVTAGLTALGIGGVALALGAQKTLENFMASLNIIMEQPMRVGDFCRIGDTLGIITEIGMRSTRLQTLDRTIVTIPNSEIAAAKIENYALRDQFLFKHDIGLRYETTPDQMRYILVKMRELMHQHPCIDQDPARVRFNRYDASSLNVSIFAYVHATDYNDFMEIQEDIMLRIMEIVDDAGSSFAFPSQTLYFGKDTPLSKTKREEAEKTVAKWKEENAGVIHALDEEHIQEIENTIHYAPKN